MSFQNKREVKISQKVKKDGKELNMEIHYGIMGQDK
jgi:hypothetical protein